MMQIKELVLYGYNGQIRRLPFSLGKVNIITGKSKTGKSVIGDVIDYCLGGSSCNIAEGIVRKCVAWYALVLQFENEQMFVARRNPDPKHQSSTEFFYKIDEKVEPPAIANFISNADVATIESMLSARLGIKDNLFIPSMGQTRDPIEANIRHALCFCFQKQSVVAVNTQLFHRQNEPFVAQAIKVTLPYFFGVIDDDFLQLESERIRLRREISIDHRMLSEQEAIAGNGLSRAYSLIAEAQVLGIIASDASTEGLDLAQAIALLQSSLQWSPKDYKAVGLDKVASLQDCIEKITQEISQLTESIRLAKSYIGEDDSFSEEVKEQKLRLESIGLFEQLNFDTSACPLCSSKTEHELPSAKRIRQSIIELDHAIKYVERERPQLIEHINKMENECSSLRERRRGYENEVSALIQQRDQDALIADCNARCGRVIGRISLWLENVETSEDNSEFRKRLEKKEARLAEIESHLSDDSVDERMESVLSKLSQYMTQWAKDLCLEHVNCPYRFDYRKMTVIVDMDRPVPLRQIGSGSNWLGIHIITYFGLQRCFIQKERPVPQFIFIDQPSQVYFPADDDDVAIKNQDREEVSRVYDFIFKRVQELEGKMQVIIVDHAKLNSTGFKEATVEDWWHGGTLVPTDWDSIQE